MSSVNFVSGNRSVGLNQFHFEWCPKYRKNILENDIRKFLMQTLIQIATKYKILIHSMEVAGDHVRLFLSIPFDMSVSKAFQYLKGISAHELFEKFSWLRNIFTEGHLWSPGKFCRSVSNVTSGTIVKYIEGHKEKELRQSMEQVREEAKQMKFFSFF